MNPAWRHLLAAALCGGLAAWRGGALWILAWPAASSTVLALAYLRGGGAVFGKGPDGRLRGLALPLLAPYLLVALARFHARRLLLERRRPAGQEVAPGLWLGRRPLPGELPPGTDVVVDLTAELAEPRGVVAACRHYLCLPVLDRWVPEADELEALIERIEALGGTAFIHCGAGKGRSAMAAAAVLLARGGAGSVEEAEAFLRRSRPAVRLHPAQRDLLRRLRPAGRSQRGPGSPPPSGGEPSSS